MTAAPPASPDYVLGQRCPIKDRPPYGFRYVDSPAALTKPSLIMFGGAGNETDELSNGLAKRGEIILGHMRTDGDTLQVFGVKYPPKDPFDYFHEIIDFNKATDEGLRLQNAYKLDPAAQQFTHRYLLPLIADNASAGADGKVTGQKIDINIVKKRLRNIHFFGHSYGVKAIHDIEDTLIRAMQDLGYNQKQVEAATSQVLFMTVGSTVSIDWHRPGFTKVHIMNVADHNVQERRSKTTDFLKQLRMKNGGTSSHDGMCLSQLRNTRGKPVNSYVLSVKNFELSELTLMDDTDESASIDRPRQHYLDDFLLYLKKDVSTYFDTLNTPSPASLLPTAIRSIMRNGMDNALRNAAISDPKKFVPLPDIDSLLEARPQKDIIFTSVEGVTCGKIARLSDIAERIGLKQNIIRTDMDTGPRP